jgi:hypothetical protein
MELDFLEFDEESKVEDLFWKYLVLPAQVELTLVTFETLCSISKTKATKIIKFLVKEGVPSERFFLSLTYKIQDINPDHASLQFAFNLAFV